MRWRELVAELGAAFLCADLGLTPELRADHAAYIASWLKVLKADKRAVFTAAAHAQRAADFLHGRQLSPAPASAPDAGPDADHSQAGPTADDLPPTDERAAPHADPGFDHGPG
jgi:antirestriction protein ArdC